MTASFLESHQRAIACYSDDNFAKFFELAGITDPAMQSVGKDILGIAGGHYFSQMDQLAASNTRAETLKHLKRVKRASRDLADSLQVVMADRAASNALIDAGVAGGRALQSDLFANNDTLHILDAIFPISGDGSGFREEGLQKALRVLANSLEEIEGDIIPKARRGRGHALAPWLQVMVFYWIEATKEIPTVGHYYSETGDYASVPVAALSFVAERLDREISSSLIAAGLQNAVDTFSENPLAPVIALSVPVSMLMASKTAFSDDDTLATWLGMPLETIQYMGTLGALEAAPDQEKSTVSKEEFFESIKTSESGKTLLQGIVDLDEE